MLLESDSKESPKARVHELAACKESPWRWLTHWTKTEDARNKEKPFQPFPNQLHLQILTHAWLEHLALLVPKSRQMTCTWLFCGLYLHDSMFYPSRYTVFQSKIEDDSDANLKRAKVIHEQLPKWMREWQPMHYTHCNASFPRSRSVIEAVAEGSKHYRQKTLTGAFIDEGAFTNELDEVIAAAQPALGDNGRMTIVSSASPGYFKSLVFDETHG